MFWVRRKVAPTIVRVGMALWWWKKKVLALIMMISTRSLGYGRNSAVICGMVVVFAKRRSL